MIYQKYIYINSHEHIYSWVERTLPNGEIG
jgi:hypothetical protein